MTIEARLDMLETLATTQQELAEVKRDSSLTIQAFEAEIETQRRRAEMWKSRHNEMGRAFVWSSVALVVSIAAHFWRSM